MHDYLKASQLRKEREARRITDHMTTMLSILILLLALTIQF